MKVKMLTSIAGADFSLRYGDEYDTDDAEAKRLIEAGFAEPVAEKPKAESRPAKKQAATRDA